MPWSASAGERWRRAALPLALLVASAALAWRADTRTISVRTLAQDDEVVRLDAEIESSFGMRNPIVWVVVARGGDIWNQTSLAHVQTLTREALRLPGVVATDVISIASPNVRDVDSSEDAMAATYLMPRVPADAAEMRRLRRRIERNPSFAGTLISDDNQAAVVIADFRDDTDAAQLAVAARALRDTHTDAQTATYAVGAPLLGQTARGAASRVAVAAAVVLLVAGAILLAAERRRGAAMIGAAVLGVATNAALLLAAGALVLPWAVYALLPGFLVGAALVAVPGAAAVAAPLSSLVVLFGAAALVAPMPLRDFAAALAAGLVTAFAAGIACRATGAGARRVPGSPRRHIAFALSLLALGGCLRLHGAFGAFGYGRRYLPHDAAADLDALARHFPPTVALALLARGEPGFVKSPAVLELFQQVTERAGADPAVRRAMSLADLLLQVHRAFSGDPRSTELPRDPATLGRYLALGYSPGFRHFVDRAFTKSAIWVYASNDDPRHLARIEAALAATVAAHSVPGVSVAAGGGDGAIALRQAQVLGAAIATLLAALLGAAAVTAAVEGVRAGLRFAAAVVLALLLAAGLLGLLGVPIDLLSATAPMTAALAAPLLARAHSTGIFAALLASAMVAALLSLASGSQLGYVLAVALAAPAIAAQIAAAPATRTLPFQSADTPQVLQLGSP